MVKSYLKYEEADAFGVIAAPGSNAAVHPDGTVFCGALDTVLRWHVRRGSVQQRLRAPGSSAVVSVALSPDGSALAAGHFDGRVRLWDVASGEERVALHGHRRAATAIRFAADGSCLATGAADTDIVVWDVVAEAGRFRLHGHRDGVTDVCFVCAGRSLVSSSKDGLLKVWDTGAQRCVHTAVAHSGEVWAVDVAGADGRRVVSGGVEDDVRLWTLVVADAVGGGAVSLEPAGTIARRGRGRIVGLRFDGAGKLLAAASASGTFECWTVRSVEEVRKAAKRLAKRQEERAARKVRKVNQRRAVDEDADADADAALADVRVDADAGAELGGGVGGRGGDGKAEVPDGVDRTGSGGAAADANAAIEFAPRAHARLPHKVAALALAPGLRGGRTAAAAATAAALGVGLATDADVRAPPPAAVAVLVRRDNALDAVAVPATGDPPPSVASGAAEAALAGSVHIPGHRSEVRALCLSGDGRLVATASDGEARVWAVASGQLLHALACGYGLCCAFIAASTHLLVGTKAGSLQLFHLGSASLSQELPSAHEGCAVWSARGMPGGLGVATAGADKALRIWALEALRADAGESGGAKGAGEPAAAGAGRVIAVRLAAERTLRLTDEVLACAPTADGRLLAVSLLDATVKVVYADTFRFYLSLYGHRLPALAVDTSSDGALLVSGSADKSVRIWALDFGDCRRALHGHSEAVTAVRFVRDTHYIFTAGKDRTVRYWDADTFQQLQVLAGHHSEVWALDVTRDGGLVASAGRDRSVRVWRRTDAQLFVQEEMGAQLEAAFDEKLLGRRDEDMDAVAERSLVGAGAAAEATAAGDTGTAAADPGEQEGAAMGREVGLAGRRSLESVTGSERLFEALAVLAQDEDREAEYKTALADWQRAGGDRAGRKRPVLVPNLLLLGKSRDGYLLHALRSVKTADLEQALLLLPFTGVVSLLRRLPRIAMEPNAVELCARVAIFCARTHHRQLSAAANLAPLISELHTAVRASLAAARSIAGRNLAALRQLRYEADAEADGDRLFAKAHGKRMEAVAAAKAPGAMRTGKQGRKGKSKGLKPG